VHLVDTVFGVGWIAFWIYWFAAATHTKASRRGSRSYVGIRVAVLLVVVAMFRTGLFKGRGARVDEVLLQGIGLATFVTTGPYSRVRHPIYSGLILALIGTTIAISLYLIVVTLLLGAYFVYSATVEERSMEQHFPDTYPAYKRSTKMLVPFVF
jgi:protein-S-isoprenylcysteine O-methyltransferase Ste14